MTATINELDPNIAKTWLDNKEAVLVDVREVDEYETLSIPGAKLIPLASVTRDKLPIIQEGQKIIVHCARGARSARAIQTLQEEHPELPLYNLTGGITLWAQLGLPVVQKP